MIHEDVHIKVEHGYASLVYLNEIKNKLGTEELQHLKISPIAMVPHKSRKYRAILDLSFHLKLLDMKLPSVNVTTLTTAPLISMS